MTVRVSRRGRSALIGLTLPLALATACGEDPGPATTNDSEPVVISADWLAGTLSYASLEGLLGGQSYEQALLTKLDLSEFSPGPLSLELTPDKKHLLVAVSAGFFGVAGAGGLLIGAPDIPPGKGVLLIIDVDQQQVTSEVATGETPMGIAVTPDGERAFVAHFDSGNMAVVDLRAEPPRVLDDVEIGIYAEEVVFDETGSVGVVSYSAQGSVRTFAVDDPKRSLSAPVELQGDSAGLAFFPGTKRAFVVQAPNPLAIIAGAPRSGYTLLDVSDPSNPVILADVREAAVIGAYPAMPAPDRGTVLVPAAVDGVFEVREYALQGSEVKLVKQVAAGRAELLGALGFAYDGRGSVVMAVPGERALVVTDLDLEKSRSIPWGQTVAGPTDVVIR